MASVLAVLDGARLPFDGSSSKLLYYMLERPAGCDVTIDHNTFEIRYGWNPARHRYMADAAAGVVSGLLSFAQYSGAVQSARLTVGPATVPAGEFLLEWSFGTRLVWLDRSRDGALIRIRDAASHDLSTMPDPIAHEVRFDDFAEAITCPRCGAQSQRYRRLLGDALVCPTCARSFTLGDSP